jgi:TetR/AcrR family transcriptional regulator, tetracycline repressor protein
MRRLAAELAVMPNTLYSYFADKDALLDALLDAVLGDVDAGDPTEGDWREGLVNLMDSSRRLLLAHPQLVPVFVSRPTLGPNAARLGEITFQLLRRGGLKGELAVEAFWVLIIYSLGFAAFQAPRLQDDATDRTERSEAAFAGLPPERFPEMRRVATFLSGPPTDRNYHTGLIWLLDGVSSRAQPPAARRSQPDS